MDKRKGDFPQAEVEITPEIQELLEEFTVEEIATGVVVTGRSPEHGVPGGMEGGMFEELLESVREAGLILRGEREAARRMFIGDTAERNPTSD